MEPSTNLRDISRKKLDFWRPKVIGFYSTDPQRNHLDDCSWLRYLRSVPAGPARLDLNRGAESAVKKNIETQGRLKNLLSFLKHHREALDVFDMSEISLGNVPFVFNRGFLCSIGSLPYRSQDPYRFSACLFRGVLYIKSLWTAATIAKYDGMTDWEKSSSVWGHKFEQYLVSDDPNNDPDTESPVTMDSGFFCVLESRMHQHRLIYGAEMDCVLVEESSLKECLRSDKHSHEYILQELGKCQFVELKVCGHLENAGRVNTFRRHNTRSWWLQCFFSGIETIICGYRDGEGIVTEIKPHRVSDLLKMNHGLWDPNVCLNFCNGLLKYIKDCFAREISRIPGGNVLNVRNIPIIDLVFERLPRSGVRLVNPLPDDIPLLTDSFINMFSKD